MYKRNVVKLKGYGVFIIKSITTDEGFDTYIDSYTCQGIFIKNKVIRPAEIIVITTRRFFIRKDMSIGEILIYPWLDWDFR